jgi:hypothetical protein
MRGPDGVSRRAGSVLAGRRMLMTAALAVTIAAATAITVSGAGSAAATTAAATWTPKTAPLPLGAAAAPDVSVTAVACPSSGFCAAVGSYTDDNGIQQGLLLVRTNGAWTATEATLADGSSGVTLNAVGCLSAGDCVAVGYYDNPGDTFEALLLTLSATIWTQQAISGTVGGLETVGCSTSAGCVIGDSTDNVVTLVGGVWTATSVEGPVPGGYGTYQWDISGIACLTVCYPVGSEYLGGGPGAISEAAVVASGSGTAWTAGLAPLPADADPNTGADQLASVNGIACRSSQCTAAGTYVDTNGDKQAMLLTRSHGEWAATEPELPTGAATAPEAGLDSVACPAATSCVAVGTYTVAASGTTEGLIESGAAGSWTPAEAPLPAGGVSIIDLTGVACASSTVCSAVGTYETRSAARGLLLNGAGSGWAATAAPHPTGGLAGGAAVRAVGCAATTTCIAVGDYASSTSDDGLIETLHDT